MFRVPLEERRYQEEASNAQSRACREVSENCGVSIEVAQAKDQSITIFVNGRVENVLVAKREILERLQTQVAFPT